MGRPSATSRGEFGQTQGSPGGRSRARPVRPPRWGKPYMNGGLHRESTRWHDPMFACLGAGQRRSWRTHLQSRPNVLGGYWLPAQLGLQPRPDVGIRYLSPRYGRPGPVQTRQRAGHWGVFLHLGRHLRGQPVGWLALLLSQSWSLVGGMAQLGTAGSCF